MAQDFSKADSSTADPSARTEDVASSYDFDALLSAITPENLQRATDFVEAPPRGKEIG